MSVANWRLLFIVEVVLLIPYDGLIDGGTKGIPTILVGIVCLFALLDRPESTHSLNAMERKLAMARMNRGTSGDVGKVINKSTYSDLYSIFRTLKQITGHVLAAILDWRVCDLYFFPLTDPSVSNYLSGVCIWRALFRTVLCYWFDWSLPANDYRYHGLW